jgi:hypothetical protein
VKGKGLLTMAMLIITARGEAVQVGIETLVMPGPVIEGHVELEKECSNCHAFFSKETQRSLCLDCHEDIAADITATKGFHGQFLPAREAECKTCHGDHLGREADVTGLDEETFDHSLTDFELRGVHRSQSCTSCHEEDEKFRDTSNTCVACHEEDEPHRGNLGEQCSDCHNESRWTEVDFDHDQETDFHITGKHTELVCGDCHRNQIYENTPMACVECHRVDDVHVGRNGTDCADCHVTAGWADLKFDHFDETGFALADGHSGLVCEACHESGDVKDPDLEPECYACHRGDDEHQGRNGTDCAACHQPTQWEDSRFDHAAETEFVLQGKHAELTCSACHKDAVETQEMETGCVSCHAGNDPHETQLGTSCNDCHNEQGWGVQVRFDHDLTSFPLIGLHATVPCEECHTTQAFQDTSAACVDCHKTDDNHDGALGEDCGLCHNSNDWGIWVFNHDVQTDFSLDGAHAGLACENCHDRPAKRAVALPTACGSCHRRDDVHEGQFGNDCGRCHTTESFAELQGL